MQTLTPAFAPVDAEPEEVISLSVRDLRLLALIIGAHPLAAAQTWAALINCHADTLEALPSRKLAGRAWALAHRAVA